MDFELTPEQKEIRAAIRALAGRFGDPYWRECDANHEFPFEFYEAFAEGGWLSIAIPREYGGGGLGITEAAILLREVAASGAAMNGASALHLAIFGIQPLIRHGSDSLKAAALPDAASGRIHLCFAITEPDSGSDTPAISMRAIRDGNRYILTGKKVWISGAGMATKAVVLARTTPLANVGRRTDGMSLFWCDLDTTGVVVRAIDKLGRNAVDSNEVFFDQVSVSADRLIGVEGQGFYHLLDGLIPERICIAAEALGTGLVALERAIKYAKERFVFGRAIGQNQGIQFPLADSHLKLKAAELLIYQAAWLFDTGQASGAEANMAKFAAAEWAFEATDRAMQVFGGFGYAKEYDVERYWREARLMRLGPVSQELALSFVAHHVLGLPKSY